ncbi:MAG: hypothetical protein QUS33_08425 [Dehalococcoidia bacterium]|nr:hypothetical protein [Dehalococcoidia bacterium]
MDKLIYILWGPKEQERKQRQEVLLREVAPKLLASGARKLTMYIADQDSDFKSAAPFHPGERMCAEVALWLDSAEQRTPHEEALRSAGFRFAGYLVDESIYTEYGGNRHSGPRNWPDGTRSPGIVAVTLMERPKRLSREEWIRRWHGRQSPVSEAMQPRCRYIRNVVVKALTPDAPPYEGIVEEAWPSVKHATNPFLFYGAGKNPFKLVWNMIVMLRSVTSFLDLTRIRTTYTSEYILKS